MKKLNVIESTYRAIDHAVFNRFCFITIYRLFLLRTVTQCEQKLIYHRCSLQSS